MSAPIVTLNTRVTDFVQCPNCEALLTERRVATLLKELVSVRSTYQRLNARKNAPRQYTVPESLPGYCSRCARLFGTGDQS